MNEVLQQLMAFAPVETDRSFKDLTTLRIGGKVRYTVYPKDIIALDSVIGILETNNIPYKFVGKGSDRGHKHGKVRVHDTRVDSSPGVEGKDKIKVPQNLAPCGYAFPDLVAKILVPASGIEAILKKDDPSPGVFGKPLPQGCRAVVHGFGNRACLDEPEFFKPLCKALQNELMVCVGACLPAEEPQGPLLSHGPAGMLCVHEGGSCPKKREKSQDGNTKSNHALSSPQQCVSWPSSPCSRQRMVISSA